MKFSTYFDQSITFLEDINTTKMINIAQKKEINDFLNRIKTPYIKKQVLNLLESGFTNKEFKDAINDIGKARNIKELLSYLQDYNTNTYKSKLFKLGDGEGEILSVWALKGSELSSTSKNFDFIYKKDLFEVKAYNSLNASMRLGTTEVVSILPIWDEILHTLKKINQNYEDFSSILGMATVELSHIKANYNNIKRGALGNTTLKLLASFFEKANKFSKSSLKGNNDNEYNRLIFRGNNIEQLKENIMPIDKEEILKAKENNSKIQIDFQEKVTKNIIGELRDLYYVRFPENFMNDLQTQSEKEFLNKKKYLMFIGGKVYYYDSKNKNISNIKKLEIFSATNYRFRIKAII